MKHLIRFLARLYPASWRQRYGAEFAALLEDSNPDWRASLDVLKGALGMQIQTWNLAKILVLAGVAGALVALAGSFALPKRYASQAIIKIGPHSIPGGSVVPGEQDTTDYMYNLGQRVLRRTALTSIIQTYGLYQAERVKMPIEDVIELMRKRISLLPVHAIEGFPIANAVAIQFVSDDPATAQKVTQDLTTGFIDQNIRDNPNVALMTLDLLDPASLPGNPSFPPRPLITTVGFGAGLALGAILAWFRRPRRA